MAKHVTAKERNEMRQMRATGATLGDISVEFNRGEGTVWRHVHDVPPPPQGWVPAAPKRKFDYSRAASLIGKGVTATDIAERFGVTPAAVCVAMKRYHPAALRQQRGSER